MNIDEPVIIREYKETVTSPGNYDYGKPDKRIVTLTIHTVTELPADFYLALQCMVAGYNNR